MQHIPEIRIWYYSLSEIVHDQVIINYRAQKIRQKHEPTLVFFDVCFFDLQSGWRGSEFRDKTDERDALLLSHGVYGTHKVFISQPENEPEILIVAREVVEL